MRGLTDPQQLHLEDQRGAGWNHAAGALLPVAEVRGDHELALAAHAHGADALVPALDDAALADRKLERLTAVDRRVELLPALQPARVVHAHVLAGLRHRAGAFDDVHVAQPGRGLDDLFVCHALTSPRRRGFRARTGS